MDAAINTQTICEAMEAARPDFDEAIKAKIAPYLFDETLSYPDPYHLLEYNGVGFSALDNIQALTGQKKNGKTFGLVVLMAAILSKENGYLPGLRVPERTLEHLGRDPLVLYVDTEMALSDTAKVVRRTKFLCGWDFNAPNPRFHSLNLRLCKRQERLDVILAAMEYYKPDAVFVDGLRDLVSTINAEDEAIGITDILMREATLRHCSIWCALHQNPREGESKMRGWLGSELGNKCTDTLEVSKDNKPKFISAQGHGRTFTVAQQSARGMEIDSFGFEVTDLAGNLGVPRLIERPAKATAEAAPDAIEKIQDWLLLGHGELTWPATKEDLKGLFKRWGNVTNRNRQTADVNAAINRRLLLPQDESDFVKGQASPRYYLNEDNFASCVGCTIKPYT